MRSIALLVAFAFSLAGCGQITAAKAPGGEQIRAYLLEHPEVIEEAIGKLQQKRQAAADSQLVKTLAMNRPKLERDGRDFVAGNPNGAVTMVEFFDYRCPYCKTALPEINKLIESNKDLRFVLKEFPILSPVSESAARAAIGAKAQGKYWPVHQALLAEKNLDEAAVDRILRDNGVDVAKAKADGAAKPVTEFLDETHALARAAGVSGTPAFMVGDKMIAGWIPADIQAGIEAARKKG